MCKLFAQPLDKTNLIYIYYLCKVISFSRPFSRTDRYKKLVQVPFKTSRGRLFNKIQTFDLTG